MFGMIPFTLMSHVFNINSQGNSSVSKNVQKSGLPLIKNKTQKDFFRLNSSLQLHQQLEDRAGHFDNNNIDIKALELERNQLLKEEAIWRQICRNNWIKNGDLNTKFFHKFC